MSTLNTWFDSSGYLPHGYCFTWTPGLLWSMVGADGVIAAAYFSIPLALVSFVRKRGDSSLNWVAWLFSAFIFACGVTHVMDIWTIWQPDYGAQAFTKTLTAVISLVTAVALWPLIPRALKIPSVARLQVLIESLQAEVGQRRAAQDQLVDAQQSLAVTLAGFGAGFIATDRAGCVTSMNALAEQTLGWTLDAARGKGLWEVFVRDEHLPQLARLNQVEAMIEQGITADTSHNVVALARDGTRVSTEMNMALTYAADGSVRGLAMVFRDMTRLERAESESSRLAAIVESSFDAIIGKTLDGRITSWNRAAQAMFGYSADQAIGQRVQMLIPPDREAEEMRILTELARGASVPAFDTVRLTRDGTPLDVSVTISPIRDSRGVVVGASKIARNISLQRRAATALRDSDSLLRTIRTHFIVSITDHAGRITEVNDSFCGISGYAREELFGQTHRIINSGVQEPAFWVGLWRTISAGRPWRGEICNRAKDGSLYWVDSVIAPFVGADGRIERYISIRTDITAAKRAEGARLESLRLEAENRQIREASRLKSLFLANMSHELRTPLNAIIGFADLLHSGAVKPDSLKHQLFLGHIRTSGRHLLQLINDVLDLSKVESGKFEFFPEPIELRVLIGEVADILHTSIQRKQIRVSVDVDPALASIVLDPARLKQVLYNYLSNAIKFTPEGGAIVVRAMADGPLHFRLEVEDNGIGIAAADLPRLFADFQQLDAGYTKQHEGTGLGLALTRRLVRAQGGSVGVRSTLGRGSVFFLVLNRHHGKDAEGDTTGPEAAPAKTGTSVLVIDDDGQRQSRIVSDLSEAGFHVDVATTGEQALRQSRGRTYDAITLDLMMPDLGGLAVLESIRSEGASRASPVLGMSMPVDDGATATFAIADVLSKPIRVDEVIASMARFRAAASGRANVLVIDDDPIALDLMRTTLLGLGIEAVCVLDGREALRDIGRHRPDAIILDLMMPGFDGFEVLDALRQLPEWHRTPVFIWTSMILTAEECASLSRSAQAILGKGGGELAVMLEALRRWRPTGALLHEGPAS